MPVNPEGVSAGTVDRPAMTPQAVVLGRSHDNPFGVVACCAHRPGVAAKRRNPRLRSGIAPRLDHASIDAAACAIGHGVDGRVIHRVRHAEGVPVDSRGCRRFADTPGRNDRCPSTPKSV